MSKKIKVIIKQPDMVPYVTYISNKLENLQKTVDGYIETVTITVDMVIIRDEEGRLKNKPYNCTVCGVDFVGTIIFAGVDNESFTDIPIEFKNFKKLFSNLWETIKND